MNRSSKSCICAALLLALPGAAASAEPQKAEMAGYLLVSSDKVPDAYNAGFSLYAAAWPLLQQYPGHRFQTGLFGTWMHAQYEGKPPAGLYSDIEGGLGWWRDTHFPTATPKFIMGGVTAPVTSFANTNGLVACWHFDEERGRATTEVASVRPSPSVATQVSLYRSRVACADNPETSARPHAAMQIHSFVFMPPTLS